MSLTAEAIDTEFKQNMAKLMGKYGKYSVPKEEAAFVAEIARAKYACLAQGVSKPVRGETASRATTQVLRPTTNDGELVCREHRLNHHARRTG